MVPIAACSSHQGNGKYGAEAQASRVFAAVGKFDRLGLQVRNMEGPTHRETFDPAVVDGGKLTCMIGRLMGDGDEPVAFRTPNGQVIRLAQTRSRFGERIEHSLQIESRATDHLEHVGGGRLLLQRLAQLVEQTGVLDRDHCLGGEVLNQANLLVGERADFLSINDHCTDHSPSFNIGTARIVRAPATSTIAINARSRSR